MNSDIVKYVAHNIYEGEIDFNSQDAGNLLCDPEIFVNGEFNWQTGPEKLVLNGWEYQGFGRIGKRQRLYGDRWIKGTDLVYIVSEEEPESYNLAVIADNKEAIEKFCKDNKLAIPFGIEENDTVNQWL